MIISLTLGTLAALCWGTHDICIRYVSQKTGIFSAIFTVLIFGAIILSPACLYFGNWQDLTGPAIWHSGISGALFTLASIGLYKAFAIGPVSLVAPIVGSYPIMSVGLAIWNGGSITLIQIMSVFGILLGITIIAHGDNHNSTQNRKYAIVWAVSSAVGFFGSFAFGQAAAGLGAELPVIWLARIAGIVALLFITVPLRLDILPNLRQVPTLAVMGLLDAIALAVVIYAGTQEFAVFATVTASTFGLVTVLLAWVFLKEKMSPKQWLGVTLVFTAIGLIGLK